MSRSQYSNYDEGSSGASTQPHFKSIRTIIIVGILMLIASVLALSTVKMQRIQGNELAVKETMYGGVLPHTFGSRTYFLIRWTETLIPYDMSSHIFVMNNKSEAKHQETSAGRNSDAYKIQSSDMQDMEFNLNLRWRIDPVKLVRFHTRVREHPEEKLIRPCMMRVVKDCATKRKAIEAYSGQGLVDLQKEIETILRSPTGELAEDGIIVDNFVIEHIGLDAEYISQIKAKQVAQLEQSALVEKQKAAEAKALVAKADAQADYNKQVVAAEGAAKVQVTKAQADNEQAIIAAKAEQQKRVLEAQGAADAAIAQAKAAKETQQLEAEGKRAAMEAIAQGTLAQGKAEAVAKELMLKAWGTPGADNYVKVQISENLGTAYSGIKGYLPGDMKLSLLTGNFLSAVDAATGNVSPVTQPKQ